MTLQTIIQVLASGLLMGLIYALIAVGLSLIFGLMDVVNFAHGEMLMLAMYASFGLVLMFAVDPIILAPLVVAALFVVGALSYLGVVRFAMRAKANLGMVQIFATFGLAIVIRGVAQLLFTPDYRSDPVHLARRQDDLDRRHLPAGAAARGRRRLRPRLPGPVAPHHAHRFRQGARGDAGGCGRGRPGRHRQEPRVHARLGPRRGRSSASRAPSCRSSTTSTRTSAPPSALIAYVTVALGGFGSVFGALAAGILVGLVEAMTALILPPSLKAIGIYGLYLLVVFVRPRGLFGHL